MDKKNNNNWFQDIIPPTNQGFVDGTGYLDRLMSGSSDPLQRQLLSVSSKTKPGPARNNKNKSFASNKKFNHNNKAPSSGPIEQNIDDISWIAERKKRFPKTNPDSSPSKDTQTILNNTKSQAPVIAKRKMTLFEKLMDDQQT